MYIYMSIFIVENILRPNYMYPLQKEFRSNSKYQNVSLNQIRQLNQVVVIIGHRPLLLHQHSINRFSNY